MQRFKKFWNSVTGFFRNLGAVVKGLPQRKLFRGTLRVVFIVIGVFAAYFASICFEEGQYRTAIYPTAIIVLVSILEFVLADIITEARYPVRTATILERLNRNLAEVHGQIRDRMAEGIAAMHGCDQSCISATLHLVVEIYSALDDQPVSALLQVTDYTGTLGGRRWRITDAKKGLIGRCLRTQRPQFVNFASACEYTERMVADFGFSPSEVETHTKEARSYWAQPVFLHGQMIAVLYLFSIEPQAFPHALDVNAITLTANQIAGILEVSGIV